MDRGVQSESIQYNRVHLSFVDMSRNTTGYLTPEYAKFGRSEGHQFFSTNG